MTLTEDKGIETSSGGLALQIIDAAAANIALPYYDSECLYLLHSRRRVIGYPPTLNIPATGNVPRLGDGGSIVTKAAAKRLPWRRRWFEGSNSGVELSV